jgi:hypothetical protein
MHVISNLTAQNGARRRSMSHEHSGLVETWEVFLVRDVYRGWSSGDRTSGRVLRALPLVRVRARTGYDAVTDGLVRFSARHGLLLDRSDVGVRKLAVD